MVREAIAATGASPRCEVCGGLVKAAVISFGQAMPEAEMRRAAELAARCDFFLVAGSSLVVHPAATLPLMAAEGGADLVIVNRDPTPLDDVATAVLRGSIGDFLGDTT